jgi:hypothetical protein
MVQSLHDDSPGLLHDPFKDWPNSDLLIDEEDRAFFTRHFPAFAPIFDWPELRALFVEYDSAAAHARKHSRRAGILAVIAGFLSLFAAAGVPLAGALAKTEPHLSDVQALLGGIAAGLALVSILIGYTQVLTGKEKARWLLNRFWTERIRQLHFQLIINHLSAVIAAAQSDDALQNWLAFRTSQLDEFKHNYLRGAEDKIHHLKLDEAEGSPWIVEAWEHPLPAPASSPQLDTILDIMERQRFGIQQRYAERKLRGGVRSPETSAQSVRQLSDTLTAFLLLATITAGVASILAYWKLIGTLPHFIAALAAAIASAGIVALRAMKEGLLFGADADRYRWYSAAVHALLRRYEHANRAQRILILRELEHIAYQEMRRFILSVSQARFVM